MMKKRIFALVLSCLVTLTVLPMAAFAETASAEEPHVHSEEEECTHTWVLDAVLSESDCRNQIHGIGRYYCENCGAYDYQQLPLHSFGTEGVITKPASCTENGVITYTCTKCDATYTEGITATGHTYDNGQVTTEPSCTGNGVRTFTCSACGDTYTEAIPATGHTYDDGVKTEATCTANGYTTYTCTGCGASYQTDIVPATGHSYDGGVVTTDPTCTDNGIETFTCTDCGATYTQTLPATGHDYSRVTVTDPTCTEDGYTTHACACGASYITDVVPATGHNYDSGVVTTDPSCTQKGVKTFTCTNGNCTDFYTQEIPATGHSYDGGVVTDPTCTEEGYTTYTCTSCGTSYKTDVVPATGHKYDDGSVTKEATCIDEGVMLYTCTVCGYEHEEIIPATAEHQWSEQEYVTSDGLCVYRLCTVCDEVLVLKNFGSEEIIPGTDFSKKIDAAVSLSAALEEKVELTVSIDASNADLAKYTELWLEINGVKYTLTASDFTDGAYTGKYQLAMVSVAEPITAVLKGTYSSIECATEQASYSFALLEGSYTEVSVPTTVLDGATTSFVGRGVLIGETVSILYGIDASTVKETDVLVLRYYDNGAVGDIYRTIAVSDMELVDGVYTAEITISASDWKQMFAATVCDGDGNALSNTNYYSVSLYASRYITDDMEDSLSKVLRAMMQAIAA